jgi:hypothetical protein
MDEATPHDPRRWQDHQFTLALSQWYVRRRTRSFFAIYLRGIKERIVMDWK